MMKKITIFTVMFLAIDQIVKALISLNMDVNSSIQIINNFFSLTYVQNDGAAFSILSGNVWIFIIAGFVALNLIYFLFIKNKNLTKKEILLYSLLISGILGNLVDRVILGYVIDYLDFIIFGYDFAIFNIADSFIVVSVVIIIIKELVEGKNGISSKR